MYMMVLNKVCSAPCSREELAMGLLLRRDRKVKKSVSCSVMSDSLQPHGQ